MRDVTMCGFCEYGIYRGRECPYCDGSGRAPNGPTTDDQPRPLRPLALDDLEVRE